MLLTILCARQDAMLLTYVVVIHRDPALSCVSLIFNLTLDNSYSRPSSGIKSGEITTIFVIDQWNLLLKKLQPPILTKQTGERFIMHLGLQAENARFSFVWGLHWRKNFTP